MTAVDWSFWNHSEATRAKYGHNLTDDNVLNKDVVVVWQQGGGAKFDLGQTKVNGKIVGVYQLRDTVTGKNGYDGGHLGEMPVRGFGRPGEKGVMAWAVVSIRPDGSVAGGGYPEMHGGDSTPYQTLVKENRRASGHQYEGRAAEITFGQTNYVPITAN